MRLRTAFVAMILALGFSVALGSPSFAGEMVHPREDASAHIKISMLGTTLMPLGDSLAETRILVVKTQGGTDGFPLFGGDNDFPDTRNGMALLGGDNDFPMVSRNELKTCGLVDFDKWSVREGLIPKTWFLTVSGRVASTSLRVQLMPVIYTRQPEHWEIQVVACTPPIALPIEADFNLTISVTSFMGTKGIEIVGATRKVPWDKDEAD